MELSKLVTATPDTTVRAAARLMAKRKVSAVMVVEGERLVGVFTERDAVVRVLARGRDADTSRLAEVMTSEVKTIEPEQSFGYALLLMHENGFRHLPVVEGDRPVGVVSARAALNPDLEEFTAEAERRKYYSRVRR